MLEHADRNYAVESFGISRAVASSQIDLGDFTFQPFRLHALIGDFDLLLGKCNAGDFNIKSFGEVNRQPAPAGAKFSSTFIPYGQSAGSRQDVFFLLQFTLLETIIGMSIISAGILHIRSRE